MISQVPQLLHIHLDLLVLEAWEINQEEMTNKSTLTTWQIFTICYKNTLVMVKKVKIHNQTKISTFKIKNQHK